MTARTSPVTLTPLFGFPEVRAGDDLAGVVLKALQHNEIQLSAPSAQRADAVLSQTVRVVAERMTTQGVARIVESVAGPVLMAAGVDASNTADASIVLILPADPDAVAAEIRGGVQAGWATDSGTQVRVGVVLSDTAGRPWRIGQTDFALGTSGLHVVDDLRGSRDADGRILSVTERCVADEIASAADLVKGKTSGIPAAHVRGLSAYVRGGEPTSGARDLVRTGPGDWFGLGRAEAVRAALGVEPGSAQATAVGIPPIDSETLADKANRALRVALLSCPDASGHVDGDTIHIVAPDDFALGVAATRAQVALCGEGLTTTLTRVPAPTHASGAMATTAVSAAIVLQ